MKVSTQGQSRFLTHDEVRPPLFVTMSHVTEDRTLRNPFVLHFTDSRLKPLPMNLTNRRLIVAAFGDDDSQWHGRQIELYFNPSIPNPRNPAQPGGICVRIPTGNGTGSAPTVNARLNGGADEADHAPRDNVKDNHHESLLSPRTDRLERRQHQLVASG